MNIFVGASSISNDSKHRQTSLTCLPGTSRLHLSQNIQFPTGSRKRPPLVCRDAIMDSRYIETEESGAKTSIKISSKDWMQPEQRRCRVAQAAVIYLFVFVTSDKFICPTSHLSSRHRECPILHHYLPNINTILLIYIWRQQTDSYTSQSTGVSVAIEYYQTDGLLTKNARFWSL